ncbi:hypothetical protein UA08_01770 [Talaromyces atroroseus]|uniref:Zn(2)-C6 fungal-type domain-containing protein n=1 Tax=Talaromyces atroroseus TaxID=1441469 RepID=A0A1Q5QBS5_TALAT|nr:hypothetical protein UA08_01770 [Talaromyces atroroseus]OKL63407.1 hypothetical protein UA08_01770 [Talaromyces atroroseus]
MRSLPAGIYTPLPCFFKDDEDLDLEAFKKHVQFIAGAGTVPVISGSMGEAVHLSHTERIQLIKAARSALDEIQLTAMPIVAGAGANSTRESIELAQEAAQAGADFVMVIPPGYYAGALLANDSAAIKQFFVDIAEASPVPVILYNFPAVSNGIDINSDLIVEVVKCSPNVCGVKLTCANVGKLTRIMAQINHAQFQAAYPRKHPIIPFRAIDGFIDFLLPSISVGSSGAISGLPNIAPKACVRLWELCQSLDDPNQYQEAQKLQNTVALADGLALKIGIAGMKKLLNRHFGYGDKPRRPLLPMADDKAQAVFEDPFLTALLEASRGSPPVVRRDFLLISNNINNNKMPRETAAPKGRIYKSRKTRPCDACRRRKVACDMPAGPPCRRCMHMDKACTFDEGPSQRKRRAPNTNANTHAHSSAHSNSDEGSPFGVFPERVGDGDDTDDACHYLSIFDPTRNTSEQTNSSFANGILLDPMSPLQTTAIATNHAHPTHQASLEFIPDAFSFYIGPTGVSDIHLLSQQQYDEQNISRPKVRGLKYRVLGGENATDCHSTIFGITDRSLLDKAEPKVDYQTNESAWSELWQILDPVGAWHLIGLYSRFVDPYFPIVSRHQIPNTPDLLSNMSLGLLTAMCATALPFIMYNKALYTLLLRPPSSQDLYRLAWLGITAELHAPSLTTLQACLILQQRLPTNLYLSDTAFTWTLMSTAVATAQTIGLHRDPSAWLSVPMWERQLRRRLWWALWAMEKWIALARGMPSHLHDDDSDVAPISIADIKNTLSVDCDNYAHLCHLVMLTGILSDIQHTYYTVRAISRTSSDLQYALEAARPLRARLKEWRDHVPDALRFRGGGSQSQSSQYGENLDGNGALHLSYIVVHMTLVRALLRPLNTDQAGAINDGAKAVVRGALLCVKEFVEFIETLTETQWNAFWHSWSRPNFAIAGSFMVHVLHIIAPPDAARQAELEAAGISPLWTTTLDDDYRDLLVWIRRWRRANRVSANGAAGVKGLTNLGLMKVETQLESSRFESDTSTNNNKKNSTKKNLEKCMRLEAHRL